MRELRAISDDIYESVMTVEMAARKRRVEAKANAGQETLDLHPRRKI